MILGWPCIRKEKSVVSTGKLSGNSEDDMKEMNVMDHHNGEAKNNELNTSASLATSL